MKNLHQINTKRTIKDFRIKTYMFLWIFEGNGEYQQKHNESDYRQYIERNYESKSNQN